MADITARAAPLAAHVVRVNREERRQTLALAISVVMAIAVKIVTTQGERRVQPAAEADEYILLTVFAACFELIDFAQRGIWPNAAGSCSRDRSRQRRIDIARANDVQYPHRVSPHRQREVMRQLALNLSADDIDGRNFQIGLHAPDYLLRGRRTRKRG